MKCLESSYPKTIIWAILSKLIWHLYCMSTIASLVSICIPPKEQTGGSTLPVFSSGGFHGCKWEEHANEDSQNSLTQDQAQPSWVWALLTFTLTQVTEISALVIVYSQQDLIQHFWGFFSLKPVLDPGSVTLYSPRTLRGGRRWILSCFTSARVLEDSSFQ